MSPSQEVFFQGTCVEINGKAVIFTGASGSGKSATALAMIAAGARLVSDDQVRLEADGGTLRAHPIDGFEGLIEARGLGILKVDAAENAEVTVIVDLDQTELHRLPPRRNEEILGVSVAMVFGRDNWSLVPGLLALLRGGRVD